MIGAGRFGRHYLRILKELHNKKDIELIGVFVRSKKRARELEQKEKISVRKGLDLKIIKKADASIIVTPNNTHCKLIRACLPFCHVLVEKPLGTNFQELQELQKIKKYKNKLMVGHIYRWNPTVKYVRTFLRNKRLQINKVYGEFISPANTDSGQDPVLEHLHLFDILETLFGIKAYKIWARNNHRIREVYWRQKNGLLGNFIFGWHCEEKTRCLKLIGQQSGKEIIVKANLQKNRIEIIREKNKRSKIIYIKSKEELLKTQIQAFLALCKGEGIQYPNISTGARVASLAIRSKMSVSESPRIGIIGGGIFGLTCALYLPSDFRVTIFDQNPDILMGASFANQYRHHAGFHYPRSRETIQEILDSENEFRKMYSDIIVSDFPSYYAVAKEGSKISPESFIKVFNELGIWYQEHDCPSEFLNKEMVSLTIKTKEAVYDYDKMKHFIKAKLSAKKNVNLSVSSRIKDINLHDNGEKTLTYLQNKKIKQTKCDYLINATYANINQWCKWLQFEARDLHYYLKELVVLKIASNSQRCAVTIMDGDFATLVPKGFSQNEYTFGDVPLSIHEKIKSSRYEAKNIDWTRARKTRWEQMQKRCLPWLPILSKASYVSSMFITLPVEQGQMSTDGRPTLVTDHGFGCWSVLSGKIMTSAKAARQISEGIIKIQRK